MPIYIVNVSLQCRQNCLYNYYDGILTGLYCSIFAKIIAVSIYFRAVTQDEILPNNWQIPPKMLGYQIRM